jgi:hypothetical protein
MLTEGSLYTVKRKAVSLLDDWIVMTGSNDEMEMHYMPSIWGNYSDYQQITKEYPDANIYGIWQIILFNNLVKGKGWNVVLADSDNGTAVFFELNNNELIPIKQCKYVNGNIVLGVGEKFQTIDVDISNVKLPKLQLLSDQRRIEKKLEDKKRDRTRSILVAVFLSVLVVISKYQFEVMSVDREAEISKAYTERDRLLKQLDLSKFEKIESYPVYTKRLKKMLHVIDRDPNAFTKGDVDMSNEIIIYVEASESNSNRFISSGVFYMRHPSGTFMARIENE